MTFDTLLAAMTKTAGDEDLGAALCDGFMARLAEYDAAMAKTAGELANLARLGIPGAIGGGAVGSAAGGVAGALASDEEGMARLRDAAVGAGWGGLAGAGAGHLGSVLGGLSGGIGMYGVRNDGGVLDRAMGHAPLAGYALGSLGAGGVAGGLAGARSASSDEPSAKVATSLGSMAILGVPGAVGGGLAGTLAGGIGGIAMSDEERALGRLRDGAAGAGLGLLAGAGAGHLGSLGGAYLGSLVPTPPHVYRGFGDINVPKALNVTAGYGAGSLLAGGAAGGVAGALLAPADVPEAKTAGTYLDMGAAPLGAMIGAPIGAATGGLGTYLANEDASAGDIARGTLGGGVLGGIYGSVGLPAGGWVGSLPGRAMGSPALQAAGAVTGMGAGVAVLPALRGLLNGKAVGDLSLEEEKTAKYNTSPMTALEHLRMSAGMGAFGAAAGAPIGAATGGAQAYLSGDGEASAEDVLNGALKGTLAGAVAGGVGVPLGAFGGGNLERAVRRLRGEPNRLFDGVSGALHGGVTGATVAPALAGALAGNMSPEEVHKTASAIHYAGQQSAVNVLVALSRTSS